MNEFLLDRAGPVVDTIVSVCIAVSIINAVLAIVLQISRLLFSAARDSSWPESLNRLLGSVHPRLRTPSPPRSWSA